MFQNQLNQTHGEVFVQEHFSSGAWVNSIDIININGVLVKQVRTTQTTIDVSELPVDIYFLKLNGSIGSKIMRFVKK